MKKRELLRRGFALALALCMLAEAGPWLALRAYAEDEAEEQVEVSTQAPAAPETPAASETPAAPETSEEDTDISDVQTTAAPEQMPQTLSEEDTPEEKIAAQSQTGGFVLLVNGTPAQGLTVSYGQPLHFSLEGYTGADAVGYAYATEEEAARENWTEITDGDCTLEPGNYRLYYGVNIGGENWVEDGSFSIVVGKGTVGAPTGLTWTGSRMSWAAPTRTAQGGALDSGAVTGYSVTVTGAGKQFGPYQTGADTCYYNHFSNNITNEGGAGLYTFTVQAMVAQDNPHYSGSVASAPSGAYHVPRVSVEGGRGIASVTPKDSFLLLPGNADFNTQNVTATVAEGYAFAGWTGEGVTFGDANALSTTVSAVSGYAGGAELKVYANAIDTVVPTVTSFAVGADGLLTAAAQDGQTGIARYAFSTAENAGAVAQWQAAGDQQSFAYAPEAGGVYYFYAQDADGNTTRSDSGIPVTKVTLVDYYPIEAQQDRTVFLAGEELTLPRPGCAGYSFRGWYENPDFTGDPVTQTTHDPASGRVFYAQWEQETLTVPQLEQTLSFVYDGKSRTLSVSLNYTGNLSYQWYKDGEAIQGATYSHYAVKDVADSGAYCVQITLTNALGTVLGQGTTTATQVRIDRRPVVIRPDDQTITFGDSLPELGVSYLPVKQDGQAQPDTGLAPGEVGSAVIKAGTVSCEGTAPHPVGTYAITASGFTAGNYDISYAQGTLTVKPRPSSDVKAEIVYDGEDRFFVYNGTEIHPTVQVTAGASGTPLTQGTDYTLSYENAVNASTDGPRVVVTLCGNYSGQLSLPFAIHKASFEAQTQIDASWLYGDGQTHAPAVTGNTSQGEVTYRYAAITMDEEGGEVLGTATAVQPVNAGTYAVTAQIGETENYEAVTAASCRFTIQRRTITISTSSAEFVYDGLPHADHGYTVEGEFAPGEGFTYIVVTGAQTDVTQGVDNTAEYALNSITNPINYDIQIVPGKLVVTSIQLPIPANAGWSTAKPGTVRWVAVSRDQLTAGYVLQLYARADGEDTALGNPVTVSGTEHDFSEAIRADAATRKGSEYYFTIQTVAQGDSAVNYGPSQVSELLGPVFTVCVRAEGDEHVSAATLTLDGASSPATELVLLNGETAFLAAAAKEGYQILGWEAGEGLVLQGDSVRAALTASVADSWVRAVTEDKAPEILSYEAVNTEDYQVRLRFTARDAVGLTGWLIQKTAEAPAEDALWNAISATEYKGEYIPQESGEYYLFVKDTAGSVVCYSHRKAETNADGEVVYSAVPEPRGVNRITLTHGNNATGADVVVFKAANTSITLPTVERCGFVSDGFAFRNWSAPSGIYADGGAYGANADETLTALWTDQHFDYTVDYYYMEADGSYPADPALTESHSVLYGTKVATDTPILQHPRTGFTRDESHNAQITVDRDNLSLDLYYRREAYSLTYRYTIPGQQETEMTVTRLYGQDLSGDFLEEDKPTAPGYTFVGWHFGDTGSMPTVMPAADVVATGEFIPAQATVSVRYFLQDLEGETYTLQEDLNRELVALHGEKLTLESIQPGQVEGFTYAGALASYGIAYDGTTLPEDVADSPAGAVVSGEADNGLYINLFYTRNSYQITLNVWQGSVGTGSPVYTHSWTLPYGEDLTTGDVTAQDMESFEQDKWPSDDGYILAAAVDWSTDDRPETMPAGDVTVTRQFIRKTHGTFRVEVWLEGETENTYAPRTFEYIGYVGTEVSVGGEDDTVKLSGFANSIPDFQYYQYLEVADSDDTGGTVLQGIVTDTDGIFTEGGQKQEPLVLRVFYERQTMTSTITYHVQDEKGNTTEVATATKHRKWGHTYEYEALALFHGTAQWKEAYDDFTVITGDPVSYDYCEAGYVASCNGYYQLDGVGHWPTKVYNTVESLSSSFSNKMGVANNYVNVYYTKVNTAKQYYLDVVYNAGNLTHGKNEDVPVTYTLDGKTYNVRVANKAYFYTDAVYHPGSEFVDYPGLAYYSNGNPETNGYFTYSTLDTQYTRIDETHYIAGDYIYIAVPSNPFYYGHRASYHYPETEIGNASVTKFLTQYREKYADDPYAAGAHVYNRGWGSSIAYGDSKLTITFRNGSVYSIYYDVSGTVCTRHQYPAGSEITEIGCSHDVFPAVEGYEIVWYREDGAKPELPFTLNGDLRLVGKYEKVTLTSTEYAYYELADHVMRNGGEVAYITRHNMADFAADLGITTQDGQTLYTYRGNVVMVAREVSSQSFTNLTMDTAPFGALVSGVSYDASNPGNHLRGCVETEGIQLEAYFQRQAHTLTIDKNIPDTNREQVTLRTGQHYTLDTPARAGYTLSGWKLGDSEDETPLDENGTVTVTCPDSDILATAVWAPAPFTQTFVHYYQNPSLGYDTELVSAMRAEEAPQTVRIAGPEGEISGSLYSGGGISFTLDGKTYYYRSAQLSEDRAYQLRPENLSAVVFSGEVMQEAQAEVAQGRVDAQWYDFAYAMFLSPEGRIEKLEGEDAAYENAVGMTVEYFYTLQRGLSLSLSAQMVSGGKVPEGVILTGAGNDYYYSEVVTASAALPVGYDFLGWYEDGELAFAEETFQLVITGDHSYTAAIQAKPVAEPVITVATPPTLQYGYAASRENAVTVQAQFPEDADSANYVKSYQWYLVVDGTPIAVETDGQSAAYRIPEGWDVGEYTLQCVVTVARKDNGVEATFTTSPVRVSVTAAAMTVGCVNYQGVYDAREHTIVLNLPDMEPGTYQIYYSEELLTKDNFAKGSQQPVTKKDVGTHRVYYYIQSLTNNYVDTTGSGTITITPKTLTIAAGRGVYHRTYDGTTTISGKVTEEGSDKYNLFQTSDIYTIQGLMSQDTYAGYVVDADAEYDDSHVLTASRLDLRNLVLVDGKDGKPNPNYIFPDSYTITLSAYIDRLGLDLEWEDTQLSYTAESQKPTARLLTEIPEADAGRLRVVTSGEQTAAGAYSASATLELANQSGTTQINDFFLRNGSVEYTIDKLSVTIEPVANTVPVVYDGRAHTLTAFQPTNPGDILTGHRLSYAEAANSAVSAGAHTITAANALILDKNGVSVTDNYHITYGTAILTIGKRPVTVSGVQARDKTYDGKTGASVSLEGVQFANAVPGDTLSLKPASIHASFANADVGTDKRVTVTLDADALAGDSAGNYELTTTALSTTASITPATIVVQAKNAQTVYGEDAQFSVSLSGFAGADDDSVVNGLDDITYTISQGEETPVPYSRKTPAGKYNILANLEKLSAKNYVFTAAPGVLTVSQRPVTVGAATDAKITKPYDGTTSAQAGDSMVAFGGVENDQKSGVVNGDSIRLTSHAQFNSPDVGAADMVTLTGLSIDNANYRLDTESFTIPGTITPVELTVTVVDQEITYGDPKPDYTATVTGFVNKETEAVLAPTKTFTCAYDPSDGNNNGVKDGGYPISVEITSENQNYTFKTVGGTLAVTPATITITAKLASPSAIYGTNPIPQITYTPSGMKNGDVFENVVRGEVTYDLGGLKEDETTKVILSLPNNYTITPIVSGLTAKNYIFAAQSAQLEVERYYLKISGIVIEPRVYDGTAKVYDAQINLDNIVTDGLLSIDQHLFTDTDKKSLIHVTANYTGENGKDVGEGKEIAITIQFLSELEKRCYVNTDDSQNSATSAITPRPLLVRAVDCQTAYGNPAPAFDVRYEKTKTPEGLENPDSGLVSGETADRSHVTLQCAYSVNDPVGDYDITVGDFTGSPTAALSNYAPEYVTGTLKVNPNRLATPVVAWNETTPGLATWQEVSGIGEVAVASYTAVLFRDGARVPGDQASVTVSAGETLEANFANLIHSVGPGAYTVQVTAKADEVNNTDFANVLSSQPGSSGSLYAARVFFQFAEDEDSQAGRGNTITIDGKDSYTMIAGEKDVPISAKLKNATGYTIHSVTAGEGSALTVNGGTDGNRSGDTYDDTVSMSGTLNSAEDIVLTLKLAAQTVSLDVEVTPRPGTGQASVVYGYTEGPVLTVTATPEDQTTTYRFSYKWILKYGGTRKEYSQSDPEYQTTGTNTWTFPTGMAANSSTSYYKVCCIVTATRADNGKSYTNKEAWANTASYVTNVTVNRAQFKAEVSMDGWTYGEPRKSPSLVKNTAPDNEIIQNKEYTFRYKAADAQDLPANWSAAQPTDAGRYQVRAEIPTAKNYEAFVTPPVSFKIQQTQLAAPTGLAMSPSSTAPYGLISWGKVPGVQENGNQSPASEVTVTYQVKLYKEDGTVVRTYVPTAELELDITDDIQVNGSYYFTVQAISSNTKNCLDSVESEHFDIFMTGEIILDSTLPGNTKMYDGKKVLLSATPAGRQTWYRYNGTTLEKVAADSAVNVADTGQYTCVIESDGKVYTPKAPVTITKRDVVLTSQDANKAYDGAPLTNGDVRIGGSGFVQGEGAAFTVSGTQTDVGVSNNTFTYNLKSGTNPGNYDISTVEGKLKVTARAIAQNADFAFDPVANTTYTGAPIQPKPGVTDKGLATGKDRQLVEGVDFTYSYGENRNAGAASVTITGKGNYTGTVIIPFTILQRSVSFVGQSKTETYDGTEHTLTNADVVTTGLVEGHTAELTYSAAATEARDTPYSAAITAPADVKIFDSKGNEVQGNYAISTQAGTLTIHKAAMTIRVTGEQVTRPYDGTEHSASGVTYEFVKGNPALYQESQISRNVRTARSTDAVTQMPIGYTASDFHYANASIDVTFQVTDGWLTVTRAVFAVSGTNYSGTYDGNAHGVAAVPTIPIGTTLLYSTDNGQSWSKEIPQITDVGKLTVKAKAMNHNYQDAICTYTLEVTPKAVTVTAQNKSKTYGDADPAWTAEVSGTLNGDTIQWSGTRQAGENVGSYRVTPTGNPRQGNYAVTFYPGTLRIEQRVLELRWSIVDAPDGTPGESGSSVAYDGLDKTAVAEFSNLVSWDGTPDAVVIDGYAGDTCVRNPGDYATEITGISGGASGNYRLEDTRFQWQITRRPMADPAAPNGYARGIAVKDLASVRYDGTTHTPEVVVTDALVSGGITLRKDSDYTVSYRENRDAGTARVVITGIGNFDGTIEKTFPILPRPVALQWSRDRFAYDARSKQITASITNAVSGDEVQVSLYRGNTTKDAGAYTAQATALSGASAENYTLSGAENPSHRWEITRAPITLRADPKHSAAGQAIQELTYTLVGTLYGSDQLGEVRLATTAADQEGAYPITIAVENPNRNYAITLEEGVYTLTAPLVLPTEETAQATTAAPVPDEPQAAQACFWHWLILLADVLFGVGLLLTGKVCQAESQEARRKCAKRSRNARILGVGALALVCLVVCVLGFCWLELPMSILSVVLMSIASALLHRRKFADKTPSPAPDNP